MDNLVSHINYCFSLLVLPILVTTLCHDPWVEGMHQPNPCMGCEVPADVCVVIGLLHNEHGPKTALCPPTQRSPELDVVSTFTIVDHL
jgi:hypothetical protein